MRQPNPNILPEHACKIWDTARPSVGSESLERVVTAHCTLVTPMFGGGVKPGEVDRDMPIRASALRGQLRFWWRLLYGAGMAPDALFSAESDLWGGISSKGPQASRSSKGPQASRVTLQVRQTMNRGLGNPSGSSAGASVGDRAGDPPLIHWKDRNLNKPAYALIPDPNNQNPELLNTGYSFDLVLRFRQTATPQQQGEVLEALRWWASFGGLGARTRRGLGAVEVANLKPVTDKEVKAKSGWMVTGRPESKAIEAWKKAVGALQRFRQGAGIGRNPGPGRSRWPEPDTIRSTTGTHAPQHTPVHPATGFYPRAAFGLPIVFHFKDRDRGDPPDQVLNPDGHDRMASPLILRPWFDGQRYRPAALLLPGWDERLNVDVRLDPAGAPPANVWPQDPGVRQSRAADIQPILGQGATDPLTAFMRFFR